MNRKSALIIASLFFFGIVFASASLIAGTSVSDEIQMENAAYDSHSKGIVTFTHKKHATEYATANPDLFKNGCGECHHDADHNPLTLTEGDDVKNCIECHKIADKAPSKKDDGSKLTDAEQLEYHANAIHDNCKGCHKAYNEASGTKDAPTSCTKCHPKN